MGQKIHPLGFRLGITQSHWSNWFAKPKQYSLLLQEDERLRNCIKDYVRKYVRSSLNYGGVARIEIQRKTDRIEVQIHTGFPLLFIYNRKSSFEELKRNMQKLLIDSSWKANPEKVGSDVQNIVIVQNIIIDSKKQKVLGYVNQQFQMTLAEIEEPYGEASILAEYIALMLEGRVAFRKTMKKAIQLANKQGNVKGIKIQISGRLNGAEIARAEWAREGRVPLQTLRARIDYCHYPAQTIYGVLGIKVWIFKDE
jgi:small subunit ribosomal protein S3